MRQFEREHLRHLMEKYETTSGLLLVHWNLLRIRIIRFDNVLVLRMICEGINVTTKEGATEAADVFLSGAEIVRRCTEETRGVDTKGLESKMFKPNVTWDELNPCRLPDWGYYLVQCLGVDGAMQLMKPSQTRTGSSLMPPCIACRDEHEGKYKYVNKIFFLENKVCAIIRNKIPRKMKDGTGSSC